MNILNKVLVGTAVAVLIASGAAFAQTTPSTTPTTPMTKPPAAATTTTPVKPPMATTTPAPTATTAPKAKIGTATTPDGIACSAKADTAGLNGVALKGKPRKAYRKKCIADMKKAAGKPS